MENLHTLLEKMVATLTELEPVLLEENRQLSGRQVNSVALQVVTDNKSRHLAALAHYEEQRLQLEAKLNVAIPYPGIAGLNSLWAQIFRLTRTLREMNQHNGALLEMQMENARRMQEMMNKTRVGKMVYGADGQSQNGVTGRSFNVNV